jgi:hypothetical protein
LPEAFNRTSLFFNIFSSRIQVNRQAILTPRMAKTYTGNAIVSSSAAGMLYYPNGDSQATKQTYSNSGLTSLSFGISICFSGKPTAVRTRASSTNHSSCTLLTLLQKETL